MKMLKPYYLNIIDITNMVIDKVNVEAPTGRFNIQKFNEKLEKEIKAIVTQDEISKDNLSEGAVKELLINLIFKQKPDPFGVKETETRPKITTGDNVDFLPMWTTMSARQKKYLNYALRKEQNYD
jgi:hypothetical protein